MAICTDLDPFVFTISGGTEEDGTDVLPEGGACDLLAFLVRNFLTFSGSVAIARNGVTLSASACMDSTFALTSAMEEDGEPVFWDDDEDEDIFRCWLLRE